MGDSVHHSLRVGACFSWPGSLSPGAGRKITAVARVQAQLRSPQTCFKSDDWGRRGGLLQPVRTRGLFIRVSGLNPIVDPILLVLGLTQTIFEGSMYLFVFIWVPTLQESSLNPASLPLGYIFSAFMVSMMLGSLLYTYITTHWYPPSTSSSLQKHARSASVTSLSSQGDSSLVLHAQLSSLVCAASAVTFAACVRVGKGKGEQGEHLKFWAFCLFEACVGMYYPVQGMLRGSLIANEHRATVSPFTFGTCGMILRIWLCSFPLYFAYR